MSTFRTLVVATDFSDASVPALELATTLAIEQAAKLVVTHCFEIPSYVYAGVMQSPIDLLGPIEEAAKSELQKRLEATRAKHPDTVSELRSGLPADEILHVAKAHHADLVVLGTHGRKGFSHLVMGSVAEKVLRSATVPVLTVPMKKP